MFVFNQNYIETLSCKKIPKIIWSYWDQGLNNAPNFIKLCLLNWKKYCKGWDIRFLDSKSVYNYLNKYDFSISDTYILQKKQI